MRDAARAFLISAGLLLLGFPAAYGATAFAFLAGTIQFVLVNLVLLLAWERFDRDAGAPLPDARIAGALAAAAASVLLIWACRAWLHLLLIYPIDVQRTDMLTLVEYGVRRMLEGRNPYTTYYLPWKSTLSYGPGLWGPYMAPAVLHADLRFVALAGALFVPAACAVCAVALASRGRIAAAAAWMVLIAVLASNTSLLQFAPIAHTPVYWPLIVLFAWLTGRERWYGAAAVCGLLIAARTTMVSIAPVMLIAVWHRDRPKFVTSVILLASCALVPFVPFAVWNWKALQYAMYGAYQTVIKGFVWNTTGARDTIGVTGLLLRMGWQGLVDPVQLLVLMGVYAAAWVAIGRGRRPLPWTAFALFAFSATTLWPVVYIYFDVLLLWASAGLAETAPVQEHGAAAVWSATLAGVIAVMAVGVWMDVPRNPIIDIGTAQARPLLYAGFADDEMAGRSFAWVDGRHAEILVPRRARGDAEIEIVCEPNLPGRDATQQMHVALNGVVLGTVGLREGWQTVTLPAPARSWQFGVNRLALSFANAVSPLESGSSSDPRQLSVAFDRVAVLSR